MQGKNIVSLSTETFIEHLVATKPPLIFAESAVYGDGKDWNQTELSILGDIGVATRVIVYDDSKHFKPKVHTTPFSATLLYIPGALLRNGTGNVPADWHEIIRDDQIDQASYQALYERRLLPLFIYANDKAKSEGKKALITIPGLGCGQFTGPFIGKMGGYLKEAITFLLEKYATYLPNIKAVYYDPFNEGQNERIEFAALSLFVRPLMQGNQDKPQLCELTRYAEDGDDYSDCLLYSVVAWDNVSWPGNDFYGGARATDDGVKAAATNSMASLTGIQGEYNATSNTYDPPSKYQNWAAVVRQNNLRITVQNNLSVFPVDGGE
ncbi:hypothetical protein [Methylobacter psychrophilus]|uniref:hypothetical protein n=1 Tax=Methylobacter psychrophilus TaxID=96941 RepID=UPI0021D4C3AC|nr:hypothetical protein [Methylobacter psychrophilus]